MSKLFGTDGIRGIANKRLTAELAYKTGNAVATILSENNDGPIIIGKDTRKSGDMLEAALVAGITSAGVNVILTGVIPTPGIAYLTREIGAIGGIVISASHNPGIYNGIKIFNDKGFKLSDDLEMKIEEKIINNSMNKTNPEKIGTVNLDLSLIESYENYLMKQINIDLKGIKVVVDCGHGALYKIGPKVLKKLGADIIVLNDNPNGLNINDKCGSTNPKIIQKMVLEKKADIGLSFDGDGDRIIAVDETGKLLNGDHILAIIGTYLKGTNRLKNNTIVGTIMTNMGLDKYLKENGIKIKKTNVGDRYVLEEMLKSDYNLGGEQSGHIILLDYNTTGDALATSLFLLKVMLETDKKLSTLNNLLIDYPQVLKNANVKEEQKLKYLEIGEIKSKIDEIEEYFHGNGRVVIRPSGTEPVIRVMLEGTDLELMEKMSLELVELIEKKLC